MDQNVETIELLLLVAAVVAMLARRFRIPYSVSLVLAGVVFSLVPVLPKIQFSRELIFTVLLPPLIFEAALYMRWAELRRDSLVISILATLGVILSATVTALGLIYVAHWDRTSSLLFSALISATDPISVIATFKEAGVQGRLRFLIEAESLFNDGTAAVAFAVMVAFVSQGHVPTFGIVKALFNIIGVGIISGAVIAGLVLVLAGRTEDHLVEITLTTVGAYGSFILAERLQSSGVLATLTAGLILGNFGPLGFISAKGRDAVESFWEYAAFVANSFVFLLIGMHGMKENIGHVWRSAVLAVLFVIAGRAAAVYVTLLPFARSSSKVEVRYQHILFWGGLRGALALALALGIPEAISRREEIITVTFAVVVFSVCVQGLTIIPLLKHFHFLKSADVPQSVQTESKTVESKEGRRNT